MHLNLRDFRKCEQLETKNPERRVSVFIYDDLSENDGERERRIEYESKALNSHHTLGPINLEDHSACRFIYISFSDQGLLHFASHHEFFSISGAKYCFFFYNVEFGGASWYGQVTKPKHH